MKKINFFGFMMFASAMVLGLSSCDKNNGNNPDDGKTDPSTIANANLVAYFPFETESDVKIASDITFNKKVGAASIATGRRGNAYKGASTEAYLEYDLGASNPFKSLTEFSVAVWVKAPATSEGASMMMQVDGGDGFMGNLDLVRESQAITDSMDVKVFLYDSASPEWKGQDLRRQHASFLNDKWFHLVYIYRASTSTIELWSNGQFVTESIRYAGPAVGEEQPLLGDITFGADMAKLRFGAWQQQAKGAPEGWMTYFNGMLDEMRVYNKALSAEEIKNLYDAELTQIN